ncbi:MAG TPA: ankyrin repeat domain-containing protein [Limnobacter sp.]|nr:ankyrin repeat domain-containing protein [Limnobacter sp.]
MFPNQAESINYPHAANTQRPPLPPSGRGDRSLLNHAARHMAFQLAQNLPRNYFHQTVTAGRHAVNHLLRPTQAVSPQGFFGAHSVSAQEVEMAEELYCRIQAADSPEQAQKAMQVFLNEGIEMGSSAVTQYALALGADVNQWDHLGRLPLHNAVLAGDLYLVRLLMVKGANPNNAGLGNRNAVELARDMLRSHNSREAIQQHRTIFDLLFKANGSMVRKS